jgi:anti-anti-sigma regulatory factor
MLYPPLAPDPAITDAVEAGVVSGAEPGVAPEVASDIAPEIAMVHLPANGMTMAAEELRNQLVCAADVAGQTIVDGSAVQTIGQAVLQLLVAARRDALAMATRFEIIHPSAALLQAARACCLAEAIGLETGKAMAL